tara:strand:+ start:744 stop:1010 length:267 start_codon:yes stop_codon:yes gene_type:complete
MNYNVVYSEQLLKKFEKLAKKDKRQLGAVYKKIRRVLDDPYHFKPLRGDKKGSRRVHIGSFVLIYEIKENKNLVKFLDYDHHDKIYTS